MLEGEGPVVMEDYHDRSFRDLVARAADAGRRAAAPRDARPQLDRRRDPQPGRLPTATLASMDRYKALSNYHLMTDTPENVDYRTVRQALDASPRRWRASWPPTPGSDELTRCRSPPSSSSRAVRPHRPRAARRRATARRWPALEGHDGWLAACPFGFLGARPRVGGVLPAHAATRCSPGLTIAELFGITDGPLHEEIVRNIININGDDHRRLRNLVNPALAPRAVARYRPAMREFLAELLDGIGADGRCEFIAAIAKPYPSLVIAT